MTRFLQAFSAAALLLSASLAAQGPPPPSPAPAASVPAQAPDAAPRKSVLPPGDQLVLMQTVSAALGVQCAYCHARPRSAPEPVTTSGKSRQQVAREMFLMVEDLNTAIATATGKPPTDTARVNCVTCHRGVAIPRQLSEILIQTSLQQGADAAAAQYRDLRTQYYGRQAYDFSEESVVAVADRLANARPEASIALMRTNLEFYPQSSRSYASIAFALTRMADFQGAIVNLRKAVELDPNNANAKGRLVQLERQYDRQQ